MLYALDAELTIASGYSGKMMLIRIFIMHPRKQLRQDGMVTRIAVPLAAYRDGVPTGRWEQARATPGRKSAFYGWQNSRTGIQEHADPLGASHKPSSEANPVNHFWKASNRSGLTAIARQWQGFEADRSGRRFVPRTPSPARCPSTPRGFRRWGCGSAMKIEGSAVCFAAPLRNRGSDDSDQSWGRPHRRSSASRIRVDLQLSLLLREHAYKATGEARAGGRWCLGCLGHDGGASTSSSPAMTPTRIVIRPCRS